MASPENPKAERKKIERWVVVASLAAVLLLAFAVLMAEPLRVRIIQYRLRSADAGVRADAAAALLRHGVRGRLALLGHIRWGRATVLDWEPSLLAAALEQDMKAGRDCEPVMAAALEGMADKAGNGTRCARMAWAMRGLYVEGGETRMAIAERCLNWRSRPPQVALEDDPQVREEAAGELADAGVPGQLLLLEAVCSTDVPVAENAERHLRKSFARAVAAGKDVGAVLRALLAKVEQQGDAGRRCACIASEAWAAGLPPGGDLRDVLGLKIAAQFPDETAYVPVP